MPDFPIPAPQFNGACRRVDAGSALNWLRQGWAMFVANPGAWMAMMVIVIVIYLGLAIVPVFGPLVGQLLTPVLAAGLLLACHKLAVEQRLEISTVFAGFQHQTAALLTVGVLYMLAVVVLVALVMLLAGGGLAGAMLTQGPLGASLAVGGMLIAAALWLLLSLPVLMAVWFAPALVVFNGMPPVDALRASFNACLRNIVAFLVYGLLVMVLCFFAALPVGLGFLVLGPVLAGSVYASYRDIFLAA